MCGNRSRGGVVLVFHGSPDRRESDASIASGIHPVLARTGNDLPNPVVDPISGGCEMAHWAAFNVVTSRPANAYPLGRVPDRTSPRINTRTPLISVKGRDPRSSAVRYGLFWKMHSHCQKYAVARADCITRRTLRRSGVWNMEKIPLIAFAPVIVAAVAALVLVGHGVSRMQPGSSEARSGEIKAAAGRWAALPPIRRLWRAHSRTTRTISSCKRWRDLAAPPPPMV